MPDEAKAAEHNGEIRSRTSTKYGTNSAGEIPRFLPDISIKRRAIGRRKQEFSGIRKQEFSGIRKQEFSGIWLDFAIRGCYTRSVRNPQREFRVFLVSMHGKCRFLDGKTESGSDEGYRERPRGPRRRRGMQKLSGKRIGSGRHFGKCGPARTPKGQPEAVSGGRESLR